MSFKFICFVDKDEWESFLIGINAVNENPLIIFGKERISCNTLTPDEALMFSGLTTPLKSTIEGEQTFPLAIYLPAIIASLAEAPSGDLALMSDGTLFYHEYETNSGRVRGQYNILQRHRLELPKFDYPLKFDIDTKHLEFIVSNLHETSSIIFSREKDGLLIANEDYSVFVPVPNEEIVYNVNEPGAFSTMISTANMLKVFEVISLYESIRIGLGEDIPIVFLGTSERLKMGFMIGAQVEEDGEGSD